MATLIKLTLTLLAVVATGVGCAARHHDNVTKVEASPFLALENIGLAAPFAGESGGKLIVAGGTNFPGDPPWKKGTKVWHDEILASDGKTWRQVGKLSPAVAGGASVTTADGIICIGGGDAKQIVAEVFKLKLQGNEIVRENLPSLPKPVMACAAVQVGTRVFVVGGHNQLTPLDPGPSADVYSLDLANTPAGWRTETPLAGPPRWFPIVGSDGRHLFVVSGFTRQDDAAGKAAIHCLADVWRYEPASDGKGKWTQLPDLPRANAAAPSPAPFVNGKLLVLGGGVDDVRVRTPMQDQKGFPFTITAIDSVTGASSTIGEVKSTVVVGPVVPWKDGVLIVSGEIHAGVRTPEIWHYRFR